jgi:hypothetical protein
MRLLDRERRIAAHCCVWRDIATDYASGADQGVWPDLDAGQNDRADCNPASASNCDRARYQGKIFRAEIVRAGAKVSTLRNADIRFDRHLGQTENTHVFTEPDIVADLQPPGERNVHVRSYDHGGPHRCAEGPQERNPKGRWPGKGGLEKQTTNQRPNRFLPVRRPAIEIGIIVAAQIHR